ncbi:hypothetical protein [Burkholderia contaminans]|nr:hypothetical protein [Burkholderia contaminans]
MATFISTSGLFYDFKTGLPVVVSQGIAGSTLVAGKECVFRFWMRANDYANVDSVLVTVDDAKKPVATLFPSSWLIRDAAGPSISVVIRGFNFPITGSYQVFLSVRDANGAIIHEPIFPVMQFAPTKDLRLLVIPLQGSARNFLPTSDWYSDIHLAMKRLGAMLPVRDCVMQLATSTKQGRQAGLRYVVGEPREAWPSEVCNGDPPPSYFWDQLDNINSAAGNVDHVDIMVTYRPVQANLNEMPGGISLHRNNGFPYANCVAGQWNGIEMTAPCFGQEIGHLFGLESPRCPTFQDPNDPGHSNSAQVSDPFAFDALNPSAPRPQFIGDVMNNTGGGAWHGRDDVAYNSCDWEVLRDGLMALVDNETGTEINAAVKDPCQLVKKLGEARYRFHDFKFSEFHHLIGGFADGPQWELTPSGIVPVGPGPVSPIIRASQVVAFRVVMHELFARGITVLNTPAPEDVVARLTSGSELLHLTRDDVSGGPNASELG